MATAAGWSKFAGSSSIILLLMALAFAMAPISHQINHTADHSAYFVDHPVPVCPSGRGCSPYNYGPYGGSQHQAPCTSCHYPGACPWCYMVR
ncbi:unnamed protein product [Urochloa humidicola]